MKKISICLLLLFVVGLVACGNEGPNEEPDYTPTYSWFSETQLEEVGLKGLAKPECVSDDISSITATYLFYSVVATEEEFNTYVDVVFDYVAASNIIKLYGVGQPNLSNADYTEFYYKLVSKPDKESYYSTNPSPMYTIVYSLTDEVEENGYLPVDKVFQLEVRLEEGKIKVIINKAVSKYGTSSSKTYYKPAA